MVAWIRLIGQAFKFGPCQGLHKVFGNTVHRHDIGQVDLCLGGTGKFNLGFFSSFFQALKGHGIFFQIKSFILLKFISQPVDDHLVEIITSQVCVAIG